MMISNLRIYVYIFLLVAFLSCLYIAYSKGYAIASMEYETEIQKLRLDNKQELLNQERLYQDKANLIIRDYQNKLEIQSAEFENEISKMQADDLRDTLNVTSVCNESDNNSQRVSEKDNTSGVKCYTESELLNKIQKSMALLNECDALAHKYNALLRVCQND